MALDRHSAPRRRFDPRRREPARAAQPTRLPAVRTGRRSEASSCRLCIQNQRLFSCLTQSALGLCLTGCHAVSPSRSAASRRPRQRPILTGVDAVTHTRTRARNQKHERWAKTYVCQVYRTACAPGVVFVCLSIRFTSLRGHAYTCTHVRSACSAIGTASPMHMLGRRRQPRKDVPVRHRISLRKPIASDRFACSDSMPPP
jgi:hypothetical protein